MPFPFSPRPLLRAAAAAALVLLPAALARADEGGRDVAPPREGPVDRPAPSKPIDLVICLDTSGSMQGLINAARQKLWEVVNELATAKPMPELRVALLTYGSGGTEGDGYVVLQTGFTKDLDLVSEKLFALGTNGGTEYVGRVVKTSIDRLAWGGADAVKILFVAGNESADQDRAAPFREVVAHAAGLGVRVNAIYCGGADDGDAAGWREVAALGKGRYASIDHNQGTVAVATPFDADLERLSRAMNGTYLGYGRKAEEAKERQSAQDGNAAAAPAAGAARAASKASGLYDASGWDLVDRSAKPDFDLAKVPTEDLPEEMRAMTLEQRKAHVELKRAERQKLAAEIQALDAKRRAHVTAEIARQGLDDSKALDRAVRDAIREQAGEKGFRFEGPESPKAPAPAPGTVPTPTPPGR